MCVPLPLASFCNGGVPAGPPPSALSCPPHPSPHRRARRSYDIDVEAAPPRAPNAGPGRWQAPPPPPPPSQQQPKVRRRSYSFLEELLLLGLTWWPLALHFEAHPPLAAPQTMFQAPNRREAIFALLGAALGGVGAAAFFNSKQLGGEAGREERGAKRERSWAAIEHELFAFWSVISLPMLLPSASLPAPCSFIPSPHTLTAPPLSPLLAQYDLSEESAMAALDEVLEDPGFLEAVAEEVREGGGGLHRKGGRGAKTLFWRRRQRR